MPAGSSVDTLGSPLLRQTVHTHSVLAPKISTSTQLSPVQSRVASYKEASEYLADALSGLAAYIPTCQQEHLRTRTRWIPRVHIPRDAADSSTTHGRPRAAAERNN